MFGTVVVPVWLLILILGFAAISFATHFLFPSVRWFFRRRAEKALARLNARLDRKIDLFKLAQRTDMVARLAYDQKVVEAAMAHAAETGVPGEVAFEEAQRYAREIVPGFSATVYFGFGTRAAKWLSRLLFRVRVGKIDKELEQLDPKATVIFVMNHRSNVDYVLVTWLVAGRSAVSYAVGEWARVWPLSALIRSMGAYFIRRGSRNALYRKVLARYVHMATSAGVTQAIFPEGGLSRDGRLRPPKFGLLSYMVSSFDPLGPRDVVFVPVAVNYDRVLEDRMLTSVASAEPGKKPVFGFNAAVFARHFFHHVWMAMRGEWYRFGYTCVSFGEPVSLRKYVSEAGIDFRLLAPEARHVETEKLGNSLMQAVGRVVPALPVSLVSTAMLEAGDTSLSLLDIKQRVSNLIGELERRGSYVHIPRTDRDYAISVGLRMLTLRHLVLEDDGNYRANPNELMLLRYYANAIAHLFDKAAQAAE